MDQLKECSICCEVFNEDDHRPLVLPCGHTLCKECINTIISGLWNPTVECPICRKTHSVATSQLPTNFVVLDLLRTGNINQSTGNTIPESKYEDHIPRSVKNIPKSEVKKSNSSSTSGGLSTKAKIGIGLGAVAGGAGAIIAAPVVLTGVGFTSAGIAASSWAASMMSAAAVANGGGVAAGSMVALLQSAGAAGLSTGAAASVGGVGAAIGTGIAAGIAKLTGRKPSNTTSDSEKGADYKKFGNDKDDMKCVDNKNFRKENKNDMNKLKEDEIFDEETLIKDSRAYFLKQQNRKEFEDSDDDLIKF